MLMAKSISVTCCGSSAKATDSRFPTALTMIASDSSLVWTKGDSLASGYGELDVGEVMAALIDRRRAASLRIHK